MTTITILIDRHADLQRQLDALYAAGGDAAASSRAYQAIASETMGIEHTVIATRATTAAESEAKRDFLESLDDGAIDLGHLLAAILRLDAVTVAKAA